MWLIAAVAAFWAPPAAPTFSRDVAPILYRNCASCHRADGVAPFPLLTYDEVARRAQLIATVTKKRYMPPWLPAEPHFQHERRLTDAQIATIANWAAAGAPEGNPAAAPKPPVFTDGWQLGPPDAQAEMTATFDVPGDGPDIYQCFALPSPIARARYVRALDMRPGNPKVVHHVLVFQDTTGTAKRRDTGHGYPCFGTPGFLPARGLGGWTPGGLPYQPPADMAEILHGTAEVVLQVHYHPTGKPESDRSRLGFYFTDQVPKRHAMDIPLGSTKIDIPPGESAYKVTDHFTIPVDVDAIAINPHAHYVCKEMYGYAVLPDGTRRTLIRIPQWNFNWQQQYVYTTPIRLPADTRVEMEFTYDNSGGKERVTYGPGSRDEMAGLHIEVVPVRESDAEELGQSLWGKMIRTLRR